MFGLPGLLRLFAKRISHKLNCHSGGFARNLATQGTWSVVFSTPTPKVVDGSGAASCSMDVKVGAGAPAAGQRTDRNYGRNQADVRQLGDSMHEDHVRRLDVAVDESMHVQMRQRARERKADGETLVGWEPPLPGAQFLERLGDVTVGEDFIACRNNGRSCSGRPSWGPPSCPPRWTATGFQSG